MKTPKHRNKAIAALLKKLDMEADRLKLKGEVRERSIVGAIYLSILAPVSRVSSPAPGVLILESRRKRQPRQ